MKELDLDLPEEEETRHYKIINKQGQLEEYEIDTGKLVYREPLPSDSLIEKKRIDKSKWILNDKYRNLIVQLLLEGNSVTRISKMDGMPPMSVLAQWRILDPSFDKTIRQAKKYKAEIHADRIEDMDPIDPDEENARIKISIRKQMFDEYKWLAEKNDPDTYGNKVKHTGDEKQPILMRINTGIDDSPLEIENNSPNDENDIDVIEGEYVAQEVIDE